LRKLQQQLGDAAGHVGEDQVGQVVVGAAQPAWPAPTTRTASATFVLTIRR
jgi:hypothetical protein